MRIILGIKNLLRLLFGIIKNPEMGEFLNEYNWSFYSQSQFYPKNKLLNIGKNSRVDVTIFVAGSENIFIGDNCMVGSFSNLRTVKHKIKIGDNVMIAQYVTIISDNHEKFKGKFDFEHYAGKDVIIGNNVWIGANSIILPGVVIGDNSIVGAGAVVTKSVPKNSVAVGNPARLIKQK